MKRFQIFNPLLRPLAGMLRRSLRPGDRWRRVPHPVPLARFGVGAQHDFPWYFEGPSVVAVCSVEEMKEWLLGCAYRRDPELFQEADFWQHPATFEQLRQGDCEDFALWTWRKLVRLGFEAEFVAGRWEEGGCPEGHAWVIYEERGVRKVFDPVIREADHMVRPLSLVRDAYLPEVSVDHRFTRYVYHGYLAVKDAPPRETLVA